MQGISGGGLRAEPGTKILTGTETWDLREGISALSCQTQN